MRRNVQFAYQCAWMFAAPFAPLARPARGDPALEAGFRHLRRLQGISARSPGCAVREGDERLTATAHRAIAPTHRFPPRAAENVHKADRRSSSRLLLTKQRRTG